MSRPDRRLTAGSPLAFGLVAVGGALGGTLRLAAGTAFGDPTTGFAWTTWTVNVLGCLLLGLLVGRLRDGAAATWLRPALGTGVIGGFTTFSAVTHLAGRTAAEGAAGTSLTYLVASVVVGVVAAGLGAALGSAWALRAAERR